MEGPRLFLGMRTVIYGAPDLTRGKDWYSKAFGVDPYFDEPFYVGFNIGGYELGLDPNAPPGAGGTTAFWGVGDIQAAVAHMTAHGAVISTAANDVGEGIRVAVVLDPFGNRIGIIENPHFDPSATT
jgi:predicted enzyme related to lactoylglutathione lyase